MHYNMHYKYLYNALYIQALSVTDFSFEYNSIEPRV